VCINVEAGLGNREVGNEIEIERGSDSGLGEG
jgi:hypothetical protein